MKCYGLLLLLCCLALQADSALPDGYRVLPDAPGKPRFSIGFEYADKFDIRPADGIVPDDRIGRNGTRGLRIERTDPARYDIAVVPVPGLTPGKVYELDLYARGRNIKRNGDAHGGDVGFFAVEFKRNGKYAGGEYAGGRMSGEWQKYSARFSVPSEATAELAFYLNKGLTGTVEVDDITIREEGVPSSVLMLEPRFMTLRGGKAEFAFLPDTDAPAADRQLQLVLEQNGQTQTRMLTPDRDGMFRGSFGELPPGELTVKARLLDARRKVVLAEEAFRCVSRSAEEPPANACLLDEHGRAVVDGKPFMPIGIFGLSAEPQEFDYAQVRDAGFNSVVSYVPDEALALNLAQQNDLKLIYSIAARWRDGQQDAAIELVKKYKDHPALLAWYVSDEVARADVPKVLKLREKVSASDPWHPAWTLTFRKEDLPYYGISGDVMGVDPYPITAYGDDQHIGKVVEYMDNAATTRMPIWAVPQVFSWNAYHNCNKEALEKTRFATAEEIRAMPLLAAVMGAKGFIFYSYFDLKKVDAQLPGSFDREWPKVTAMVAELKALEPFIMSSRTAPEVAVKAQPENGVRAKAFTADDGELRVVIVGLGGKAKATVKVEDGGRELRSKYGLTKRIAPGTYEFVADKVDSDILY